MSNTRINFLLAVLLFILALSIRLEYLSEIQHDRPIRGDAIEYFYSAYNLYHFGIYSSATPTGAEIGPDAVRSPGYPLLLVPLFYGAENIEVFLDRVFLLQAVIGSITVVLCFLLSRQFFSPVVAFIATMLVVYNPHMIAIGANLLSETLFTCCLIAAVLLHCIALQRNSAAMLGSAGLLYGLAALVRPSALLLGPFIIVVHFGYLIYAQHALQRKQILALSLFLSGFILVLTPFFVRNIVTLDTALTENDRAWGNFLLGTYPNFLHAGGSNIGYPLDDDPLLEEMVANKKLAVTVLAQRVQERPLEYIKWYGIGKIVGMWQWDMTPGGRIDVYVFPLKRYPFDQNKRLLKVKIVMKALYMPIQFLTIIGTVAIIIKLLWGREDSIVWLAPFAILLYYTIMLEILFPIPRLTIPLRPIGYLFAVVGLSVLFEALKKMRLTWRAG